MPIFPPWDYSVNQMSKIEREATFQLERQKTKLNLSISLKERDCLK